MTSPSKGLYAPRLADVTFALMGLGSSFVLAIASGQIESVFPALENGAKLGPIILGLVLVFGLSACAMHRFDRRHWDDYMAQVVTQSALIGMVTLILSATFGEVLALHFFGGPIRLPMIMGAVPMACLGWAIGYAFLRLRGTGQ